MIIRAIKPRRRPAWYTRRVLRDTLRLVARNPGFHRLVLKFDGAQAHETGYLVNPDIEPEVRRSLSRIAVLAPAVEDEDPWAAL